MTPGLLFRYNQGGDEPMKRQRATKQRSDWIRESDVSCVVRMDTPTRSGVEFSTRLLYIHSFHGAGHNGPAAEHA